MVCVPVTFGDIADTSLGEPVTARPLTSAAADKAGIEMCARVFTLAHGIPTTSLVGVLQIVSARKL